MAGSFPTSSRARANTRKSAGKGVRQFNARHDRSAADLGAAGKLGTFFHGEDLRLDVAIDLRLVLELAALRSDFAFDLAVDFHFAGGDVALDDGIFSDRDTALVRTDFAFDLAIDDHVMSKADGAGDFDSAGENIGGSGHGFGVHQRGRDDATAKKA